MKSNRASLLQKLDRATSVSASLAIKHCIPIPISGNTMLIGNICVEHSATGLYNVISASKSILYGDISLLDVAVIIAQRYMTNEASVIQKVIMLEKQFSKHHIDMIHYLACLKTAKTRHDIGRMMVLEDKFQVAEIAAKKARNNIAFFKRIK